MTLCRTNRAEEDSFAFSQRIRAQTAGTFFSFNTTVLPDRIYNITTFKPSTRDARKSVCKSVLFGIFATPSKRKRLPGLRQPSTERLVRRGIARVQTFHLSSPFSLVYFIFFFFLYFVENHLRRERTDAASRENDIRVAPRCFITRTHATTAQTEVMINAGARACVLVINTSRICK